jgi:hypothetical protein
LIRTPYQLSSTPSSIRVYNRQFHAATMGSSQITLRAIVGFLFVFVQLAYALKFDLVATSGGGKNERCIRNFVSKDQLVVVTATVGGTKGDGQKVNIHVCAILSTVDVLVCIFVLLFTVIPRQIADCD